MESLDGGGNALSEKPKPTMSAGRRAHRCRGSRLSPSCQRASVNFGFNGPSRGECRCCSKQFPTTEQQELVTDRALSSTAILYKLMVRFSAWWSWRKADPFATIDIHCPGCLQLMRWPLRRAIGAGTLDELKRYKPCFQTGSFWSRLWTNLFRE